MTMLQLPTVKNIWIVVLGLTCGLCGNAFAADGEADRHAAWEQLKNLEAALETTSYRGVFVYARGPEVNATRIVHRYHDGEVTERLSQLDGGNGEIIRHGDEIICVLPEHGRLELEALLPAGPFVHAFSDRLEPMSRWYRPSRLEDGRVAGFAAKVVAVAARDKYRYSYRLWLERDSGLLLKSQVRDAEGEVLERFQFTQLEITEDISDAELKASVDGRKTRQVEAALYSGADADTAPPNKADRPSADPAPANDKSGVAVSADWKPGWTPDGFIAMSKARDGTRLLTTFSDGLATFSVFVEPEGPTEMPVGASRIGATTAYLHKLKADNRAYQVTVVGEIPPKTAMRVAQSVSLPAATGND